jgi:uncharacterized membrane protein
VNYSVLAKKIFLTVRVSYVLLLLAFAYNTLVAPSCDRPPNVTMWGVYSLPMLLFVPAILKNALRGIAWMCFLLLGYFIAAVQGVAICPSAGVGFELAMIIVLFVAAMLAIRFQGRSQRAAESEL